MWVPCVLRDASRRCRVAPQHEGMLLMALRKMPHPEAPRNARPRRTHDIFSSPTEFMLSLLQRFPPIFVSTRSRSEGTRTPSCCPTRGRDEGVWEIRQWWNALSLFRPTALASLRGLRGDLHRIGAVTVAEGGGVDFFELDFAVQHLGFPGFLLGTRAWNSGITSRAKSSRLSQICSCVFLPAWFNRMTWSICELRTAAICGARSRVSRSGPRPVRGRGPRGWRASTSRTHPTNRPCRVPAVCGWGQPIITQCEPKERDAVGAAARFLIGLGAHEIAGQSNVGVGDVIRQLVEPLGE